MRGVTQLERRRSRSSCRRALEAHGRPKPAASGTACGCWSPGAQTASSCTRASATLVDVLRAGRPRSSSTRRRRCPRRCRVEPTARLGLHLSTPLPGGPPVAGSSSSPRRGALRRRPHGRRARAPRRRAARACVAPYLGGRRLWVADLDLPEPLLDYLARHGSPIRYRYVAGEHPLSEYQTVFATEPGSAEMPSAGRPFTPGARHARSWRAGIASRRSCCTRACRRWRKARRPTPSGSACPSRPLDGWTTTRADGGRVIAVGTTAVRAIESAVAARRHRRRRVDGWTDLVVTPETRRPRRRRPAHRLARAARLPPAAARGGRRRASSLERSYAAALAHGYLWHEFGDVHLILP